MLRARPFASCRCALPLAMAMCGAHFPCMGNGASRRDVLQSWTRVEALSYLFDTTPHGALSHESRERRRPGPRAPRPMCRYRCACRYSHDPETSIRNRCCRDRSRPDLQRQVCELRTCGRDEILTQEQRRARACGAAAAVAAPFRTAPSPLLGEGLGDGWGIRVRVGVAGGAV